MTRTEILLCGALVFMGGLVILAAVNLYPERAPIQAVSIAKGVAGAGAGATNAIELQRP